MQCVQCKSADAGTGGFCKDCGAPLDITLLVQQLVRKEVEAELNAKFQDGKALQTEWIAATMEKLSAWVKLFAFFAGVPVTLFLILLGAAGFSKYSDFTSKVDGKVKEIESSADARRKNLESTASDTEDKLKAMSNKSAALSSDYAAMEARFQTLKGKLPAYEEIGARLERLDKEQAVLRNKVDSIARDSSLSSLQPQVAALARMLVAKAHEQGIEIGILETCRTQARQTQLFNNGATQLRQPGAHGYGLAFDVIKLVNGEPSWQGSFDQIGHIGTQLGLTWGGDWGNPNSPPAFRDNTHFQLGTPAEMVEKLKTAKPCIPAGQTTPTIH